MAADFPFQRLLVATDGSALRGFLSFFVHEGMARIGWMGVDPERHRQGIGRALVDALVATLRPAGVEGVLVDTLGDAVDYAPYARTRAFYRALGFADFRRVTQDDPECPEQLTLRLDLTGGERSG
jgi:GNAT superfamily N-acetyltransferase